MNLQHILDQCVKDDRKAQRRLYEYYYPKMMGVCYRYTDNHDDAREIFNNSFFKVFKNLKKTSPPVDKLDAWIYRIIINTSIDHYRKTVRHRNEQDIDNYIHIAGEEENAIERMSAEEIMELVRQLTPAYRTVFNMYVIDGYNHREIAEQLGISEGTSKSNLSKARMKLQQMILSLENPSRQRNVSEG